MDIDDNNDGHAHAGSIVPVHADASFNAGAAVGVAALALLIVALGWPALQRSG